MMTSMKRSLAIFSAFVLALFPRIASATIEGTPAPMAVADIVKKVITGLLSVAGAIFFVMFLWGGVAYMTSSSTTSGTGSTATKVNNAKKILVNAVIGMILIMLSYSIVSLIATAISKGGAAPAAG